MLNQCILIGKVQRILYEECEVTSLEILISTDKAEDVLVILEIPKAFIITNHKLHIGSLIAIKAKIINRTNGNYGFKVERLTYIGAQ